MAPPEPEMSAAELQAHQGSCAKLEGTRPDSWEGSTWNALGWTVQYMWVFGIVVSTIACITAVRTYNLGATDFKNTEVFKEANEYQVDMSGSSVFDESSKEAPQAVRIFVKRLYLDVEFMYLGSSVYHMTLVVLLKGCQVYNANTWESFSINYGANADFEERLLIRLRKRMSDFEAD